jgi:hypothetical protein
MTVRRRRTDAISVIGDSIDVQLVGGFLDPLHFDISIGLVPDKLGVK